MIIGMSASAKTASLLGSSALVSVFSCWMTRKISYLAINANGDPKNLSTFQKFAIEVSRLALFAIGELSGLMCTQKSIELGTTLSALPFAGSAVFGGAWVMTVVVISFHISIFFRMPIFFEGVLNYPNKLGRYWQALQAENQALQAEGTDLRNRIRT